MRLVDRSRTCLVAATRTVVAIPFSGDPDHPGRFDVFQFDAAVLTNLTQDHLSYHKSMDDHFAATLLLTNERLKTNGTAIIHTDDEYAFWAVEILPLARKIGEGFGETVRKVGAERCT